MATEAERRPARGGVPDAHVGGGISHRVTRLGCPCGCRTRLPWIDDPDCIRHRPVPAPRTWGGYDVRTLGLADLSRCQAGKTASS